MLTVIINWIYILFTLFCLGFGFSQFSGKVLRYSLKRTDSILLAGLVATTIYSQVFSLFYRVSIEANILLLTVCVVICMIMGRKMAGFLKGIWQNCSLCHKVLLLLIFLVWAYFTSRGYMVPDMDLYHGQSIRWIEEYGVVKGLGNLHGRFGYNSSLFAVSALYGMRFWLGRSMHAVNGFIAFLLSMAVLDLGRCFRRRKMLLSDYARVGAVYYLTTIWDELIAPSSDYAVMCTIFLVVIKWLAQLEEEDREARDHIAPYALLCVVCVFALTLKVSAGLILIFVLKPAYRLLKEKRWKEIAVYLLLGLSAALPWIARTVLITGWLFYPFPYLDLFPVDWKIRNVGDIKSDAWLIKAWAKGANQLGTEIRLHIWFPNWFQNVLFPTEKILILADVVSCAVAAGLSVHTFIKKNWKKLDMLLVLAVVGCSYLFWQFTAPMMRYGYAYVLLLAALVFGYMAEKLKLARIVYVFFLLYGLYKVQVGCKYIAGSCQVPNYVWQETYGDYELESYEIQGVTFYYSPYDGPTGYDPFPSAPMPVYDLKLRGDGLRDGFRRE